MPYAVIVSALRTPIGTAMKGTLRDTDAYQLAEHVVGAAVSDLDNSQIDDLILGEGLYGGGSCSLSHPVAATGARMLVTLVHELRRRSGGIGVAAMCAGGGMVPPP